MSIIDFQMNKKLFSLSVLSLIILGSFIVIVQSDSSDAYDERTYTQEELDAAVNKAVQNTKDFYKDYKSPAQVDSAIISALDEYIANHPQKDNPAPVFICICLAVLLLFSLLLLFKKSNELKRYRSR